MTHQQANAIAALQQGAQNLIEECSDLTIEKPDHYVVVSVTADYLPVRCSAKGILAFFGGAVYATAASTKAHEVACEFELQGADKMIVMRVIDWSKQRRARVRSMLEIALADQDSQD